MSSLLFWFFFLFSWVVGPYTGHSSLLKHKKRDLPPGENKGDAEKAEVLWEESPVLTIKIIEEILPKQITNM